MISPLFTTRILLFLLLVPQFGLAQQTNHTVVIRTDGSLWAWGLNEDGQLGDGTTANRELPVRIGIATDWQSACAGWYHSVAVKQDGTLWTWGTNTCGQLGTGATYYTPIRVGTASNWRSTSTSALHTVAVRQDGSLWSWGDNTYGQLGDGTTTIRNLPTRIGSDTDW